MRVSLLSFLVVRYNFKTSKSPSCPDGAESHGKKRSSSEHSPPQPTPQANQSRLPHLHHTHSLTHTHTHATHRNTKSLCHAPSTRGSNMFWRLLLLCSNHPSVHIHRKEGAGEESKKQEEEESLVCGGEQRRRKGPNLWHFQNGAGASDGQ